MRHGVPVAGNFLQQELAIITGAIEMMITDVQCCMASLPEVASSFHTIVATTSPLAHTQGAEALGTGAIDASKFYGQVAADHATNNYLDARTKILYGDPSKPQLDANGQPVIGPDGKPLPDAGFFGRRGADARADAAVQEALRLLRTLMPQSAAFADLAATASFGPVFAAASCQMADLRHVAEHACIFVADVVNDRTVEFLE